VSPESSPSGTKGQVSKGLRVGKYVLREVVGRGFYAEVRRAEHSETRAQFAIKVIDRKRFPVHVIEKQIRAEIRAMQALCHSNIVSIHQVLMSGTRMYLVMEWVDGRELFAHIRRTQRLSENEAQKLFVQLVDAVSYCHSRGVYHRDLKLENILIDRKGNIKITDFGMSWVRDAAADENCADELLFTRCGTPEYLPPEVLHPRADVSFSGYRGDKLDAWSCGVVLYTMLAGGLPLADDEGLQGLSKSENHRVYYPSWFSNNSVSLLRKLLEYDPEKRWSVRQCKAHQWLADRFVDEQTGSDFPSAPNDIVPGGAPAPSPPRDIVSRGSVYETASLRRSQTLRGNLSLDFNDVAAAGASYTPPVDGKDGVLVRAGSIDSTIDMKRKEAFLEMAKLSLSAGDQKFGGSRGSPKKSSSGGDGVLSPSNAHKIPSWKGPTGDAACSEKPSGFGSSGRNTPRRTTDPSQGTEDKPPQTPLSRRKSYSSPLLIADNSKPQKSVFPLVISGGSPRVTNASGNEKKKPPQVVTPRSVAERRRRDKLKRVFHMKERAGSTSAGSSGHGGEAFGSVDSGSTEHHISLKERLHRELGDSSKLQLNPSLSEQPTNSMSRESSLVRLRQMLRLEHNTSQSVSSPPRVRGKEVGSESYVSMRPKVSADPPRADQNGSTFQPATDVQKPSPPQHKSKHPP